MPADPAESSAQLNLGLEPERRIFAVAQLNAAIRGLLGGEFRDIWVAGEISGVRPAASGHWYFALKDASSQVKCVLFKGAARWMKFRPQDGAQVLARGSIDVYEARGDYQLVVEQLEPQGSGALQLAFEKLKAKLSSEGLFDAARKRPLPRFPQRLGIVTSPNGAVIRDILHVLRRRFAGLHIRLFPAAVQGDGSAEQICNGLDYFSGDNWAEVVIIARGGGSIEDLWTFNEESVARAIARSRPPVLSAIGHETDYTIADFVADLRAPTPSAAAELVICTRESLLEQIGAVRERLQRAARHRILVASRQLEQRGTAHAAVTIHRRIAQRAQQADEYDYALRTLARGALLERSARLQLLAQRLQALDLRVGFARVRAALAAAGNSLAQLAQAALWNARHRHAPLDARLSQLSPLAVLNRGYAIVQSADGSILRASGDTAEGEVLQVRLNQGTLDTVVTQTRD